MYLSSSTSCYITERENKTLFCLGLWKFLLVKHDKTYLHPFHWGWSPELHRHSDSDALSIRSHSHFAEPLVPDHLGSRKQNEGSPLSLAWREWWESAKALVENIFIWQQVNTIRMINSEWGMDFLHSVFLRLHLHESRYIWKWGFSFKTLSALCEVVRPHWNIRN